jgi:hypothetical protein
MKRRFQKIETVVSTVIIVLFILLVILLAYFHKSLETVQYYHHRMFYNLCWDSSDSSSDLYGTEYSVSTGLYYLRMCALAGMCYKHPIDTVRVIYGPSFTGGEKSLAIYKSCCEQDLLEICCLSTANLQDAIMGLYNSLVPLVPDRFPDVKVHQGYLSRAYCILPQIIDLCEEHRQIVLCGHSMGGSVALLLGVLLGIYFDGAKTIVVYTYGSPKVGDIYFKEFVKNQPIHVYNIQNKMDPIVERPRNPEYKHVGTRIRYGIDTGNSTLNHGIRVYRECVLRVRKSEIQKRMSRYDEILLHFVFSVA